MAPVSDVRFDVSDVHPNANFREAKDSLSDAHIKLRLDAVVVRFSTLFSESVFREIVFG